MAVAAKVDGAGRLAGAVSLPAARETTVLNIVQPTQSVTNCACACCSRRSDVHVRRTNEIPPTVSQKARWRCDGATRPTMLRFVSLIGGSSQEVLSECLHPLSIDEKWRAPWPKDQRQQPQVVSTTVERLIRRKGAQRRAAIPCILQARTNRRTDAETRKGQI